MFPLGDSLFQVTYIQRKEEVLLEGKDMSIYNAQHRELIRHGNLTMKAGEIIGLAGISGRGQRELLETLFGVNVLKMGQTKCYLKK